MVRIVLEGDWNKLTQKLDSLVKTNWIAADRIQAESNQAVIEMKSRCPVRTGYLRDHIEMVPRGDGARIISGAHYSGYVEFGTRYMSPRPFFRISLAHMYVRLSKRYKTMIWGVEV
jgi:HK97 gp10 family phage protein